MTPREIIAEAWAITTRTPSLRRWAFTSSLLETLLSIKLIGYQAYFIYEFMMRGGEPGFFDIELMLFKILPFWAFALIVGSFLILVIIEFFMPHVCLGAIIGLGAKAFRKEEIKGGLVLGLYNFGAIFAIHEFLTLSGISTIVTVSSLTMRYIKGPIQTWIFMMLTGLFLFSMVLKFFFSFAEEGVVIQKLGILEAIGKSFKLIVSHLGQVVFLLILLFVISLRILINAVMIILLPAVIIGLGLLLALFLPALISYTIAGIVGLALVIAASYMFGYILAFKQTVWTITYLELIQKKDLDVIVD